MNSQDHSGGVVRNNFFRWNPGASYQVDVPIYSTSPNSIIMNNTVLTHGLYQAAVELRFSGATGVVVAGNLMDADIWVRDGAAPSVSNNLTNAQPDWFVDEVVGDLHLLPTALNAIDQLDWSHMVADDFDGDPRPTGGNLVDVGADELEGPIFADGFESGDISGWTGPID